MSRLIIDTDATGTISLEQGKQIQEFVSARRKPNYIDADSIQAAAEEALGRIH
ncbi:hypothetical protein O0S10_01520 [Methanocorpusculum sp. MG]|uniref:Uncharacterized protein n=1 Tax=Methanocorpusculum petauri TaxID=3002863 RepID=A0ABT4IFE2_9EURY|nr:hypothetical protein [Methanocorpusculum petauri]MCZ0859905.1 hypothetical protein [Methanocorpusculum petauri]